MKSNYVCNVNTGTAGEALPLPDWRFGSPTTTALNAKGRVSAGETGQNPVETDGGQRADPAFGAGPDEEPLVTPSWINN